MGTSPGVVEDLPNPDVADVQQREYPIVPVPIKPVGPLGVQELPARKGAAFTDVLTTTMVKILGGPDDKRKRVILTGDADFFISFTGATGSGARFHGTASIGPVIELTYTGAIYAAAVSSNVNLGVIVEYWAD